ncbi:MAG: glycosyltransferase [Helicobacteraceae bacterium]|nr:glycosyltransferase [Helicobacteraceae bacterium]
MSKPKMTIVTPVWNLYMNGRDELFERSIKSTLAQTYDNIELIIVNNNSSDGTERLIANCVKDSTARIVFEPTQGLWYAMQRGLQEATGDYIGFMNSDDYYAREDYVETAANELARTGAEWCFANAKRVFSDGVGFWNAEPDAIAFDICPCHQTVFMSVKAMREYGGFDLNYPVSCDNMLMRVFLKDQRKYVYIQRVAVAYSDGGFSSQKENYQKNARVYAESFYNLVGKHFGLKLDECESLYQLRLFKHCSERVTLKLAERISVKPWRDYLLAKYGEYLARKATGAAKYYVFGKILLLKIVRKPKKIKWFLFGILPIYVKRKRSSVA